MTRGLRFFYKSESSDIDILFSNIGRLKAMMIEAARLGLMGWSLIGACVFHLQDFFSLFLYLRDTRKLDVTIDKVRQDVGARRLTNADSFFSLTNLLIWCGKYNFLFNRFTELYLTGIL